MLPLGIDIEKTQERKLKAILDPIRLKMLYKLKEPKTVKQIADSMGLDHHGLYHHMSVLEKAGLVELHKKVHKGNLVEKYYRLIETAMRFKMDLFPKELSSNLMLNLIKNLYKEYSLETDNHDETIKSGAMQLIIEVPKERLAQVNEIVREHIARLRDEIIKLEEVGAESSYNVTVIHFQMDPKRI